MKGKLPAAGQSISALLVEDNHINQVVTSHTLRKLGCEVTIAEDGMQALDKFKTQPFDIVFMDCQMPGMDGYAATRAAREWEAAEQRARMPIIALTAHALAGDRQKCMDAGMDDYIPKPLPEDALQEALAKWVPMKFLVCRVPWGNRPSQQALPRSGVSEETLLNLQQLLGERCFGLLDKFIVLTTVSLKKIEQAAKAGEFEIVAMTAHPMKSSSAQVGAMRLAALLEAIEIAGMRREGPAIAELEVQIHAEFEEVTYQIRRLIDKKK